MTIQTIDDRNGVFHLWHFCAKFDDRLDYSEDKEDEQQPRFIGLFSSRDRAEAAVAHCRQERGFRDWPDSFVISCGSLESDACETGFATYYYNRDEHE